MNQALLVQSGGDDLVHENFFREGVEMLVQHEHVGLRLCLQRRRTKDRRDSTVGKGVARARRIVLLKTLTAPWTNRFVGTA
jgi:hypothetical protein